MKGLEQEQPKSDLGRFGIELLLESIFQYLWLLQIWCAGAPPTGHNSQSKFDSSSKNDLSQTKVRLALTWWT